MGKMVRKKEKSAGAECYHISANTIGKLHAKIAQKKGNKLMISHDAAQSIATAINQLFCGVVCENAENLIKEVTKGQQLSAQVMKTALLLSIPGALGEQAVEAGIKAVTKFNDNDKQL